MAFCILGGPLAWSLQQIIVAAMYAHDCYPKDVPLVEPVWPRAGAVAWGAEAAAVLICLLAGAVAWRNWRRTRGEREGSGHRLMGSGDGRSRFMAMVGLLCSGLFLLATVYALALLWLVRPCGG